MTKKEIWRDIPIDMSGVDPSVNPSADVRTTIARGEAAFKNRSRSRTTDQPTPRIITSVMDQEVQDQRDTTIEARASKSVGKRQQPPMTARLKAVVILVDRLMADGIPFGVGPNSKMNRLVQEWLNMRVKQSTDTRKSRSTPITQGAVRELLKQVRALLPPR